MSINLSTFPTFFSNDGRFVDIKTNIMKTREEIETLIDKMFELESEIADRQLELSSCRSKSGKDEWKHSIKLRCRFQSLIRARISRLLKELDK